MATYLPALSFTQGSKAVTDLFVNTFGSHPEGVWQAPGRVNIIGEHTDYNGGMALPIALPHRAFIALRHREDRLVRLVSSADPSDVVSLDLDQVAPKGENGEVSGWAAYLVGVAWALEQDGLGPLPGFDIALESCVPLGAGLSSSAALECAVIVALDEIAGLALAGSLTNPSDAGRERLARLCSLAENKIAGAPTGGLDQAASLRCRAGHALALDCTDFSAEQVPFNLAESGLSLLVIDTRAPHALVDGQYAARRSSCEQAAALLEVELLSDLDPEQLDYNLKLLAQSAREQGLQEQQVDTLVRRTRHVVSEIERTEKLIELLQTQDLTDAAALAEVGQLMNASHDSLRYDYEVTVGELDTAVEAARAAGAIGARMTGGGFGGSAIALVHTQELEQVAQAIAQAFAKAGYREPAFLQAEPGPGAGGLD